MNMVPQVLKQIEYEEREKAIAFATKAYTAAIVLTLRDKFGFGAKRLSQVLGHTAETFDAINRNEFDVDELFETILHETGIDLR